MTCSQPGSQTMPFDLFSLEGRTALVTGASRGIGRMIAKGFVEAGCSRVYLNGRNVEACEAAAKAMGPTCVALAADLRTVEACSQFARRYGELESRLDILVNNAGVDADAPSAFPGFSESDWDYVMDVNIKSPFFLTQALHPYLVAAASRDRPAKVINISSIDGLRLNALPSYSYYASKSGLIWLTQRLAAELIEDQIVVTSIAPGAFASDLNIAARDHADRIGPRIPIGRIGREEDMQGAAVFLASRAGDYLVGETLIVDGGLTLAKFDKSRAEVPSYPSQA